MHTEFHGIVTAKKGTKNRSQRAKSGSHSPDVVCNQHLVSATPGETGEKAKHYKTDILDTEHWTQLTRSAPPH